MSGCGKLTFNSAARSVTLTRLLAESSNRVEPVTYWIRIGEEIAISPWQSRIAILREGLQVRIPDGMFVRASSVFPKGQSHPNAYSVQLCAAALLAGSMLRVGAALGDWIPEPTVVALEVLSGGVAYVVSYRLIWPRKATSVWEALLTTWGRRA